MVFTRLGHVEHLAPFSVKLSEDFDTDESVVILTSILTLPRLQQYVLTSDNHPRCPLLWPDPAFLALSARSGFDSTLQLLDIYDVYITAEQLLGCLSNLPSLRDLAISDHQPIEPKAARAGTRANEVVITNSLLSKLTRTADSSCLVPHLSSLRCPG
ncbi:hypothetical protein C8R45DRAFT_1170357 [Mycena sanguinolenta]|nr:hypothetical protein C8R45DRAFT_1170357 [Mycena sanguinolenta]